MASAIVFRCLVLAACLRVERCFCGGCGGGGGRRIVKRGAAGAERRSGYRSARQIAEDGRRSWRVGGAAGGCGGRRCKWKSVGAERRECARHCRGSGRLIRHSEIMQTIFLHAAATVGTRTTTTRASSVQWSVGSISQLSRSRERGSTL